MRSVIANSFHTLITQPTTLCNLDCAYCYLPDRKRQQIMSTDVAAALAASVSEQDSPHPVDVIWHGGEPLATPIRHMRSLLAEFEALRRAGRVMHGLQTNATLIDAPWCDLLAEHGVQVGVSIDGPAACNAARVDRRGKPAFERIMHGIATLRAAGITYAAICVVSPVTVMHADDLVAFFTDLGCTSVGFNLEEQEGVNAQRTPLTVQQAERFWLRLWQLREAGSRLAIRDLDRLCDWLDTTKTNNTHDQPFDPIPTVSFRGDMMILSPELLGMHSPDYGDFVIGNVLRDTLPVILTRAGQFRYVQEFADGLRACGRTCEFFDSPRARSAFP